MGKSLPVSGLTCILLLAIFVNEIATASPNNASTSDDGSPGTNGTVIATTRNDIKWPGIGGELNVGCAYRDNLGLSTMGTAVLRTGQYAVWRKTLDVNQVQFIRCDVVWDRMQQNLVYYLYAEDQHLFHDNPLVTTWSLTELGLSKQNDNGTFSLVQAWFS